MVPDPTAEPPIAGTSWGGREFLAVGGRSRYWVEIGVPPSRPAATTLLEGEDGEMVTTV